IAGGAAAAGAPAGAWQPPGRTGGAGHRRVPAAALEALSHHLPCCRQDRHHLSDRRLAPGHAGPTGAKVALRLSGSRPRIMRAMSSTPRPARARRPPKVGFVSLGCPKALVDSERILTHLRAEGYEV